MTTQFTFDFIQFDVSVNLVYDSSFLSSIETNKFASTDASAVGMVPTHRLMGLFWYSLSTDNVKFAMMSDSWTSLTFSNSFVTPDTSINGKGTQLSEDFISSIIKDIVGSKGFNCLFSNLEEMKTDVASLDSVCNQIILNKIDSVGGDFQDPKYLNDYSPGALLWYSLMNDNAERQAAFIEQINQKQQLYQDMYSDVAFYYYGNDGQNGTGFYYPLYLSQKSGSSKITFTDGTELYIIDGKRGTYFLETNGIVDYNQYKSHYQTIDFIPDDIIKIRLTYYHSQEKMYGKTINPRSYMLYLKMY